uniref:Uncharacterized protein n=1 Tax=Opuntia streptacantha TaxID=393608 RepID=A0A7C9DCV7_OPUST
MLLVALEIRHHREALLMAPIARVHLRTVASLEVILHANRRLQWPEFSVLLVPITSDVRTRESRLPSSAGGTTARGGGLFRFGESLRRLELVAVGSHMHPEIGVALESLPADVAEMDVLCQELDRVYLHNLQISVVVFFFGIDRHHLHLRLRVDRRWIKEAGLHGRLRLDRRRFGSDCLGLGEGEEGGAVYDDVVDGGDQLRGDSVHLVLREEDVAIDRVGQEVLQRVHPSSHGGEVHQRHHRVAGGVRVIRR